MASIQYITEIAGGKDAILAEAATDPKIAKKRKPDADQCAMAVLKVVEKRSIEGAASLVQDELQEALDAYIIDQGERDWFEDKDEWDSGLDDRVEAVYKDYNDILSADFLATATIDSGLHVENGVANAAKAFGKEVYKQLCWQAGTKDIPGKIKQPMQILASAGIVMSDVLGYFADRIDGGSQQEAAEPVQEQTVAEVSDFNECMARIRAAGLVDLAVEVAANLVDSDDALAQGAATQVGLDAEDAVTFQMLAMDMGEDAAIEHVIATLKSGAEYVDDTPAPPAAPASSVPPPPPAAPAAKSAVALNKIAQLASAHGGTASGDLATLAGVSRATWNNYLNDKSEWKPDADAIGRIRGNIEGHMKGLQEALDILDTVS